jgi:probable addiction module antidote protein
MAEKLTTYDPAEDLTSDVAIATFMAEAFASEDADSIEHARGVVARAKGRRGSPETRSCRGA